MNVPPDKGNAPRDNTRGARQRKFNYELAVVTIAEEIHQTWMADDRAAAQAQRTAAEEALKRLEAA